MDVSVAAGWRRFLARPGQLWQDDGQKAGGGRSMRRWLGPAAAATALLAAGATLADTPAPAMPPASAAPPAAPVGLALAVFPAKGPLKLHVTSPAFANGA